MGQMRLVAPCAATYRKSAPTRGLPSDLPLAFDVACEVVEDRLPSAALLLSRVSGVAVEGHSDSDTGRMRSKHDLRRAVANEYSISLCSMIFV